MAAVAAPENEAISKPEALAQPSRWRRNLLLFAVAAVVAWPVLRVLFGSNFHTVKPGVAYRGALQSPGELENLARLYGIRSVINLRGNCNSVDWYDAQCRTAQRLGINQEDLCFSASRLPSVPEMRRLLEVLDRAERPLFLHCRRGSDRTGLACAALMLLQPNVPLAEARGELHWRFGHASFAKTGYLDDFFDLYERWLSEQRLEHAPERFRHWVEKEYRGGWCQYEVEEFARLPESQAPGKPPVYKFRVRNSSGHTWHIHPRRKAGIHVGFRVLDEQGTTRSQDRGGLFEGEVHPGESLATLVILPRLSPGKYRVQVDLVDERQGWFYQAGAEPMEEEFEIRE